MKITVIGGGSTYTPELVNGFLMRTGTLPIKELWLMDIDHARLEIVGGFAKRMVEARGNPFEVHLTTDRRAAIQGTSYVITQLRVGQMPARRADEYLGFRHNLIGQETTGIGGMAKAMRTIPVILDITREMRASAPSAMLLNFTNPAGLVTEAITRYAPDIPAVGVCNVGITTKMRMVKDLENHLGHAVDPNSTVLNTLGLNHLTWHRGFTLDNEEMWPTIFSNFVAGLRADPEPEWDVKTIESLGMIPNYYLEYFYYTDHKLEEQKKWPPSRAEQVQAIEEDLLRLYAQPDLTEPPKELMKRGGAYYSTLATELIESHFTDNDRIHTVNIRHNGAVPGWPEDWVLEMPSKVNAAGVHPLPAQPLPLACFGLVAQVKAYELLTVEAAVHGDRNAAYQALLAHPLGPNADRVGAVLDDLLETNRAYLPQFWK
jgi:6-phospho-beta-glucosidase